MSSIHRVTKRFGVRECKLEVPADHLFVVRSERRAVQEAGNPGYIIVREQVGGVLVYKTSGDENFQPLVAIELEDAADAVKDLAAHTTATRFEPAKRATVDISQVRHLFLGQTALVSEAGQHRS